MGLAPGYKKLSTEQVEALNKIEGGYHGIKKLAKMIDDALDVALGELPSNIPQSQISGLTSALAAKLTASVAAAVPDVTTANASDLATAIALANSNKATMNALLSSLRTAGHLAP